LADKVQKQEAFYVPGSISDLRKKESFVHEKRPIHCSHQGEKSFNNLFHLEKN